MTLTTKDQSKLTPHALAASNIRKELKSRFPGIKFRVTSSSYSGGSSIYVHWENGPTSKQVDEIIKKYEYGSFDGMTDSYDYKSGFSDVFGQVKFALTQRSISNEAATVACEELEVNYGIGRDGNGFIPDWDDSRRVSRYLDNKDFTEQKEVA